MALFAVAAIAQPTPGLAQTELTVPGGATGANVFCLQAGSLTDGDFVSTFLQTDSGAWEESSKAGTFKYTLKNRDDLMVELRDGAGAKSDGVTVGPAVRCAGIIHANGLGDKIELHRHCLSAQHRVLGSILDRGAKADARILRQLTHGPDRKV